MNEYTDFDRFVEALQQEIMEEDLSIYSSIAVDHFYNPQNLGRMPNPDAWGIVCGSCGDTMEFYIKIEGERIRAISFMTDGCGPSIACGSMLTTMVRGMLLENAAGVTQDSLLKALGGLPDESVHCAQLAVLTLQKAIANRLALDKVRGH